MHKLITLLALAFSTQLLADDSAAPAQNDPAISIQVFDDRALTILSPQSPSKVLGTGFTWVEGPLWLAEQNCLIFSDIPSHRVMRYCPESGMDTYLADSAYSNGLALNIQGELILMQSRSRRVAKMQAPLDKPSADYQVLASTYEGKKLNSPNDVSIDKNDTIYFTDPPYGLEKQLDDPAKELDFQGVYSLNKDGELTLHDDDLKYPNGILLTDNESKVIVAVSDPEDKSWYQYTVDENGNLNSRIKFASATGHDFEYNSEVGLPDGLKEHSNGTIFATGPGGVWVFSAAGELLAHIGADRPVANLALDANESTLYLTAQDRLIAVELLLETK